MEDQDIITLYWERSEEAVRATAEKYGSYCAAIIRRVLGDRRDVEECLGDTWLGAWNAMPPQRPERCWRSWRNVWAAAPRGGGL